MLPKPREQLCVTVTEMKCEEIQGEKESIDLETEGRSQNTSKFSTQTNKLDASHVIKTAARFFQKVGKRGMFEDTYLCNGTFGFIFSNFTC